MVLGVGASNQLCGRERHVVRHLCENRSLVDGGVGGGYGDDDHFVPVSLCLVCRLVEVLYQTSDVVEGVCVA